MSERKEKSRLGERGEIVDAPTGGPDATTLDAWSIVDPETDQATPLGAWIDGRREAAEREPLEGDAPLDPEIAEAGDAWDPRRLQAALRLQAAASERHPRSAGWVHFSGGSLPMRQFEAGVYLGAQERVRSTPDLAFLHKREGFLIAWFVGSLRFRLLRAAPNHVDRLRMARARRTFEGMRRAQALARYAVIYAPPAPQSAVS